MELIWPALFICCVLGKSVRPIASKWLHDWSMIMNKFHSLILFGTFLGNLKKVMLGWKFWFNTGFDYYWEIMPIWESLSIVVAHD